MKKFIHKILKCRKSAVTTIYDTPIITEEWVAFGKFVIAKSLKTV